MKFFSKAILAVSLLPHLAGCGSTAPVGFDSGIVKEASLLGITDSLEQVSFLIANPWKPGAIMQQMTVSRPYSRIVVTTNSLAALLVELGLQDRIVGVCEPEWISDSTITAMVGDGRIADCGSGMYPNVERILELHPDAIFVSPFEGSGYGSLEIIGIPLIECADYMETSPLGRAEWIRLYGRLMGAVDKADSLFLQISSTYNSLCRLSDSCPQHPKVMLDTRSGSAWYTAGGGSTIGMMLADAGAQYAFADQKESGSVPLAFETVYEKAHDSDVWLLKNSTDAVLTYSSLAAENSSYSRFRPFQEKKIWVCNVNRTPYFEETAFHPERLLSDFISILHPELGIKTRYYNPLD